MKIMIIGASGFLGNKLFDILSRKHRVIGADIKRTENKFVLDASNNEEVRSFIMNNRPDVVIDTVALTSSLACEKNPELCRKLNYETSKNIAAACKEISAKMVFISSTYLFDGEKGDYSEKDKVEPINEYAKTKIMAEKEISKLERYIILRVDIMYGYNGKEKPNGVFEMILSEKEIRLREPNQIRQPVLVDDVVDALDELINKNQNGIFHVAGLTRIKMIDFLRKLEKIVREKSQIKITNEKSEIEIKIPKNATLNISKIQSLGIQMHSLDNGIKILEKQLKIF